MQDSSYATDDIPDEHSGVPTALPASRSLLEFHDPEPDHVSASDPTTYEDASYPPMSPLTQERWVAGRTGAHSGLGTHLTADTAFRMAGSGGSEEYGHLRAYSTPIVPQSRMYPAFQPSSDGLEYATFHAKSTSALPAPEPAQLHVAASDPAGPAPGVLTGDSVMPAAQLTPSTISHSKKCRACGAAFRVLALTRASSCVCCGLQFCVECCGQAKHAVFSDQPLQKTHRMCHGCSEHWQQGYSLCIRRYLQILATECAPTDPSSEGVPERILTAMVSFADTVEYAAACAGKFAQGVHDLPRDDHDRPVAKSESDMQTLRRAGQRAIEAMRALDEHGGVGVIFKLIATVMQLHTSESLMVDTMHEWETTLQYVITRQRLAFDTDCLADMGVNNSGGGSCCDITQKGGHVASVDASGHPAGPDVSPRLQLPRAALLQLTSNAHAGIATMKLAACRATVAVIELSQKSPTLVKPGSAAWNRWTVHAVLKAVAGSSFMTAVTGAIKQANEDASMTRSVCSSYSAAPGYPTHTVHAHGVKHAPSAPPASPHASYDSYRRDAPVAGSTSPPPSPPALAGPIPILLQHFYRAVSAILAFGLHTRRSPQQHAEIAETNTKGVGAVAGERSLLRTEATKPLSALPELSILGIQMGTQSEVDKLVAKLQHEALDAGIVRETCVALRLLRGCSPAVENAILSTAAFVQPQPWMPNTGSLQPGARAFDAIYLSGLRDRGLEPGVAHASALVEDLYAMVESIREGYGGSHSSGEPQPISLALARRWVVLSQIADGVQALTMPSTTLPDSRRPSGDGPVDAPGPKSALNEHQRGAVSEWLATQLLPLVHSPGTANDGLLNHLWNTAASSTNGDAQWARVVTFRLLRVLMNLPASSAFGLQWSCWPSVLRSILCTKMAAAAASGTSVETGKGTPLPAADTDASDTITPSAYVSGSNQGESETVLADVLTAAFNAASRLHNAHGLDSGEVTPASRFVCMSIHSGMLDWMQAAVGEGASANHLALATACIKATANVASKPSLSPFLVRSNVASGLCMLAWRLVCTLCPPIRNASVGAAGTATAVSVSSRSKPLVAPAGGNAVPGITYRSGGSPLGVHHAAFTPVGEESDKNVASMMSLLEEVLKTLLLCLAQSPDARLQLMEGEPCALQQLCVVLANGDRLRTLSKCVPGPARVHSLSHATGSAANGGERERTDHRLASYLVHISRAVLLCLHDEQVGMALKESPALSLMLTHVLTAFTDAIVGHTALRHATGTPTSQHAGWSSSQDDALAETLAAVVAAALAQADDAPHEFWGGCALAQAVPSPIGVPAPGKGLHHALVANQVASDVTAATESSLTHAIYKAVDALLRVHVAVGISGAATQHAAHTHIHAHAQAGTHGHTTSTDSFGVVFRGCVQFLTNAVCRLEPQLVPVIGAALTRVLRLVSKAQGSLYIRLCSAAPVPTGGKDVATPRWLTDDSDVIASLAGVYQHFAFSDVVPQSITPSPATTGALPVAAQGATFESELMDAAASVIKNYASLQAVVALTASAHAHHGGSKGGHAAHHHGPQETGANSPLLVVGAVGIAASAGCWDILVDLLAYSQDALARTTPYATHSVPSVTQAARLSVAACATRALGEGVKTSPECMEAVRVSLQALQTSLQACCGELASGSGGAVATARTATPPSEYSSLSSGSSSSDQSPATSAALRSGRSGVSSTNHSHHSAAVVAPFRLVRSLCSLLVNLIATCTADSACLTVDAVSDMPSLQRTLLSAVTAVSKHTEGGRDTLSSDTSRDVLTTLHLFALFDTEWRWEAVLQQQPLMATRLLELLQSSMNECGHEDCAPSVAPRSAIGRSRAGSANSCASAESVELPLCTLPCFCGATSALAHCQHCRAFQVLFHVVCGSDAAALCGTPPVGSVSNTVSYSAPLLQRLGGTKLPVRVLLQAFACGMAAEWSTGAVSADQLCWTTQWLSALRALTRASFATQPTSSRYRCEAHQQPGAANSTTFCDDLVSCLNEFPHTVKLLRYLIVRAGDDDVDSSSTAFQVFADMANSCAGAKAALAVLDELAAASAEETLALMSDVTRMLSSEAIGCAAAPDVIAVVGWLQSMRAGEAADLAGATTTSSVAATGSSRLPAVSGGSSQQHPVPRTGTASVKHSSATGRFAVMEAPSASSASIMGVLERVTQAASEEREQWGPVDSASVPSADAIVATEGTDSNDISHASSPYLIALQHALSACMHSLAKPTAAKCAACTLQTTGTGLHILAHELSVSVLTPAESQQCTNTLSTAATHVGSGWLETATMPSRQFACLGLVRCASTMLRCDFTSMQSAMPKHVNEQLESPPACVAVPVLDLEDALAAADDASLRQTTRGASTASLLPPTTGSGALSSSISIPLAVHTLCCRLLAGLMAYSGTMTGTSTGSVPGPGLVAQGLPTPPLAAVNARRRSSTTSQIAPRGVEEMVLPPSTFTTPPLTALPSSTAYNAHSAASTSDSIESMLDCYKLDREYKPASQVATTGINTGRRSLDGPLPAGFLSSAGGGAGIATRSPLISGMQGPTLNHYASAPMLPLSGASGSLTVSGNVLGTSTIAPMPAHSYTSRKASVDTGFSHGALQACMFELLVLLDTVTHAIVAADTADGGARTPNAVTGTGQVSLFAASSTAALGLFGDCMLKAWLFSIERALPMAEPEASQFAWRAIYVTWFMTAFVPTFTTTALSVGAPLEASAQEALARCVALLGSGVSVLQEQLKRRMQGSGGGDSGVISMLVPSAMTSGTLLQAVRQFQTSHT